MNNAELAQKLGTALHNLSVAVTNGAVAPFLELAEHNSMVATIRWRGDLIKVSPVVVPNVDGYKAEIKLLEAKVKELEKETKSLNILLEKQTPEEPEITEEPEPKKKSGKKKK